LSVADQPIQYPNYAAPHDEVWTHDRTTGTRFAESGHDCAYLFVQHGLEDGEAHCGRKCLSKADWATLHQAALLAAHGSFRHCHVVIHCLSASETFTMNQVLIYKWPENLIS
jgi:hypothetical protein